MKKISNQVARIDTLRYASGARRLPRRTETLCRLVAEGELSAPAIAARCGVSERTVWRLRANPVVRARVDYLRDQEAQRAAEEEPLTYLGNRIALAGKLARRMADELHENNYEITIGFSKDGVPIRVFDRARAAELHKALALLNRLTAGQH